MRVHMKGFQVFKDRHGKVRCYHRATRERIDLEKAPLGSLAFMAECARIAALHQPVAKAKPGTLGQLIDLYRGSGDKGAWGKLAPRTRKDYQRYFDYLKPIADTQLSRFNAPFIVKIRDKALAKMGWRGAEYVRQVLSTIFGWGAERGHVGMNAARQVKPLKRPKDAPDANRPWTDAERHAVLVAAPAHVAPILAVMMFTGLGPKDAVGLDRAAYKGGEIAVRRAKTGEPVFWPVPIELREVLDAAPVHEASTLCATSRGEPWSQDGLQTVWQRIKHDLEEEGKIAPGLTLYGLRHTVAVILRELGYDERTIADALGQKTIEMARHYAKGADLRPKMIGVVANMDAEYRRRREVFVKPKGEAVKPPVGRGLGALTIPINIKGLGGTVEWVRTTDLRSHNPTL